MTLRTASTNAGSGTQLPLVLLAGRLTDSFAWHHQVEYFAPNRPVLTPDDHAGLPTIRAMAEFIARDLPTRFDLVGWSMGGYIAFELLDLLSDRIAHLCFVSTSADPEEPASAHARLLEDKAAEERGLDESWVLDQITRATSSPDLDPDFLAYLCRANKRFGLPVVKSQTAAIINRRDARPLLPGIICPTLTITGACDPIIPPERTRQITNAVSNAHYREIPGAGHCTPYETPDQFNRLLDEFLSNRALTDTA